MEKQNYRSSFGWVRKVLIIATTGYPEQNFLGAFYIPLLLQLTPPNWRKNLALNLLAISPHYFGTIPSDILPKKFIEAENERMLLSRKCMIDTKVKPFLNPQMTVLDHGCGPGYLASAVSPYCDRVIALDISSGVIACAKAINYQPNIEYITETGTELTQVSNSTVDLIYSFAVMQHVTDAVCQQILQEFFRVLKPGGKVICEFVVNTQNSDNELRNQETNPILKKLKEQYVLRVVYRDFSKIEQFIQDSGFKTVKITANQFDSVSDNSKEAEPYYTFVLTKPD